MPKTRVSSSEDSSPAMSSSEPVDQRAIAVQYLGHGYNRTRKVGEGHILQKTLEVSSERLRKQ